MQIDLDKIKKLPPDVRDRFQKLLIKYKEEDKKELAQNDFLAFVKNYMA
jgi:ABC-type phosphate/phosphonate transport system substrate-binding protein